MLKITLREHGETVIAGLQGGLTLGAGAALSERVAELLAAGRRRLVLDLGAVERIDSSGLGELVQVLRAARSAGARLKVLSPGGQVYDTLSLARLLPLFEVYSSEDEVVASFERPDESGTQEVSLEVHERVATLTLNRPRRFNALTRQLLSELVSLVTALNRDRHVRAVVLTGAGRAFCFGADAEELREGEGALPTLELFQTAIQELAALSRPVVAAINGFATGAGLDLVLACDLRVMSDKAKLSSAFVKFGLVPDGGSTHFLPRLVGPARAAELVLTGRAVDAATALEWGLVNRVVPAADVVTAAESWARELARGPAHALARAKALLRGGPLSDLSQSLAAEAREQASCFRHPEFQEGLKAHLDKRDPCFPE